jgi:hypothetical protein
MAASKQFSDIEAQKGAGKFNELLIECGLRERLRQIWDSTFYFHQSGAIHGDLADWVIRLESDPDHLREFLYAHVKYNPGFGSVGRQACHAIHRIALHLLSIDSNNKDALWIYTNENFVSQLAGAKDIPVRNSEVAFRDAVLDIERLCRAFEREEHPLDLICELDTIAINHLEVVRALVSALQCAQEQGVRHFCLALGRATTGKELAAEALCARLSDQREEVSEAAAQALGKLGHDAAPKLPLLLDQIEKLTDLKSESHREWTEALMAISLGADSAVRVRAKNFLEELVRKVEALPQDERGFYGDEGFLKEIKRLIKKLTHRS